MSRTRNRRGGFTLMEVLLVLVILVVLGSLSVSILTGTRRKANIDAARAQVTQLKTPIDLYEQATGQFPQTLENLWANPGSANWSGPYCEPLKLDPFGGAYNYQSPGTHNPQSYDVWSNGPDGQGGTEDDIGNW